VTDAAVSLADPLAASALVTAVVAALFALWQPEIQGAINAKESDDSGNWGATADIVRPALLWRAYPLGITATFTCLILLPRAFGIVERVVGCHGCGPRNFDDVQAMVLLTEAVILALAIATLWQIGVLSKQLDKLTHPPKKP
jgi:hypothetical protein